MFNSIRTKLTLWYTAVLTVIIAGFAVLTYSVMVNALDRDMNIRLTEMARNFNVALKAEQEDEENDSNHLDSLNETISEMRFRDYYFLVISGNNEGIATTFESYPFLPPDWKAPFFDVTYGSEKYRGHTSTFDMGGSQYRLLVFHSLKEHETLKWRIAGIFMAAVPFALLLGVGGGYFLARKSLRPVVEMGSQAARIGADNLSERISVKNKRDELGSLAATFNELLARLDSSFEQQRRFMADASHELRTPLAIVRGESEVALSKADRTVGDYHESLGIVHDESRRLTKIVEDLFTLARADAGQFEPHFAPVYLDEIVSDSVRSIRVLADHKTVGLSFSAPVEMPFEGDEELLHRLFLNLLDNAVKYSRPGGAVSVICDSTDGGFSVAISDSGEGIPAEEQEKVFERFYRLDKARSRSGNSSTSGAGLGLSIAQWIAEMHWGSIRISSSDTNGSTFIVEFSRGTHKNGQN
jgi:two-component system, OmpR family, sensor kinase